MVSSTILTLVVIPAVYMLVKTRQAGLKPEFLRPGQTVLKPGR
jgi:hypothetical protein